LELKKGTSKKIKTDGWGKAKWDKAPDGPYNVKLKQTAGTDHQVHVVVKGNTLSEICQTYYGDMMLYPIIAKVNNIENPDLIYPDDEIKMPSEIFKIKSWSQDQNIISIKAKCLKIGVISNCENLKSVHYENEDGKKISCSADNQKVFLIIKTQKIIGTKINIDLSDTNMDFEYNGKILEGSTFKNLKITDDIMKIKLITHKRSKG